MSWKEKYSHKLLTPQEAAKFVKSGQRVGVSFSPPPVLMEALAERKEELQGVKIGMFVPSLPYSFLQPGMEKAFEPWIVHLSAIAKEAYAAKRVTYVPPVFGFYPMLEQPGRVDVHKADIFMTRLSPPDQNGFCSFGSSLWYAKTSLRKADLAIAEIEEGLIRTGGDNFVHIDEVDYLVEGRPPQPRPVPQIPEEREEAIAGIGQHVNALVKDGDTVQFGAGTVTSRMPDFLMDKADLGIHAELLPVAGMDMIKAGVVTGKYKTINRGKVVTTSLPVRSEDFSFVNGNPIFELYEASYTHNLSVIAQVDNYVAINNILMIDLFGQVNAESFGPATYSGTGGLFEFHVGALMSKGGRAIFVLPSTARNGTVSRIVPALPPGAIVTMPRSYVDWVVTEYGAVNLLGASERRRAELLTSIAHPDHRAELKKAARKLFWAD